MIPILAIAAACASIDRSSNDALAGADITEIFDAGGPHHGVSNGTMPPPPRMRLSGKRAWSLVGSWTTDTAMSWRTLEIRDDSRFTWTEHGCLGTTYWLGDARRDGDTLLLVPDQPDWSFGGGRLLDIRHIGDEIALVPHPRSDDDLSPRSPLRRSRSGWSQSSAR